MIDGYHAEPSKLDDVELIRSVLDRLPDEMEMTKIMPPQVFRYGGDGSEETGVTGVVIIAESHIAIHTFPEKGFVSVDVFSCKDFDASRAVNSLVAAFEIGRYDTYFINRGKEYPREEKAIERIVHGEREYLEARLAS
jgi:S-adenosylmethionine decarboxylase